MRESSSNLGGESLTLLRRELGLSQEQLCNRADCSKDSIRKFEQGVQPIGNTPLTKRLAQSLGTTASELLLADAGLAGPPFLVKRFQLALVVPVAHPNPPRPVVDVPFRNLKTRVDKALGFMNTGAYWEFSVVFTRLTTDLNRAQEHATNRQTENKFLELQAKVYLAASAILTSIHEYDLAVIAADQAIVTGEKRGEQSTGKSFVLRGQAAKARALLDSGYPNRARDVLRDGMPLYEGLKALNDSEPVDAVGSWLLARAELSARAGDSRDVADFLQDARKLAQRASKVQNKQKKTFTTTTVAMAALRLSVQVGNDALSLDHTQDLDLKSLTAEQRARVLIDMAQLDLVKSPERALQMLLKAEKLAPQELTSRGTALTTTIVEIASHVAEPHTAMLRDFVNRLYG